MQFDWLKRREFITLLGGATVTWPVAAYAQQPAMPMIAYLGPISAEAVAGRLRAFREGLKEIGYTEGENVAIRYRYAEDQNDQLPAMAIELARRQVSALITGGTPAAFAAKAATTTIPIVFILAKDPVRLGIVASIPRPGGNATGINFVSGELGAKRLELLRELLPGAVRIAVLNNSSDAATAETTVREVEAGARAMGLEVQILNASSSNEIHAAFSTIARERPDALFLSSDPLWTSRRVQLATLAARHALPMASQAREVVEAGGLMSYGGNIEHAFRQAGVYAGRILKGAKPADLPVVQSSRFDISSSRSKHRSYTRQSLEFRSCRSHCLTLQDIAAKQMDLM
jgi:putative tryptophan/tyrosine transport system substrate-binding protein